MPMQAFFSIQSNKCSAYNCTCFFI